VGAAGDVRVVDRPVGVAEEALDAADRLVVGDVGEPGGADHVPRRVDAGDAGDVAVLGLDLDVILDQLDLHARGPEALDVGDDADGHEHDLGLDGPGALGGLDLGPDARRTFLHTGGLGLGVDLDPAPGEALR